MTIWKDSYIFSAAAALLVCSLAAGVDFRLMPEKVEPGQRAVLEIRIPLSELETEEFEGETAPQLKDTLLTESKQLFVLDRDFLRDGEDLVWRYDITTHKPGSYRIPPVEVVMGPRTFSTEARTLEVATTRQKEDLALRPEFGELSYPWQWEKWGRLAMWLVLLAAAAGAAHWIYSRYIAPRLGLWNQEPSEEAPEETPEEWLAREFARLRGELETAGAGPAFVDELTLAVRTYLAKKQRKPVEAWTTSEMRSRLQRDPTVVAVSGVFEICDRYKFAATSLPVEDVAKPSLENCEKILLCGT